MRVYRGLGALILLFSVSPTLAQTLTQQQKALAIIRETANDICGSVPLEQTNQQVDLTGSAKAKLSGALGKIVDAGISGAAKYTSGSSKGVLQKDLAQAIKAGSDCRQSVFQTLAPRMVLPATTGQAAPAIPTEFKKPAGYFKKQGSRWVEYPPYAPNQFFTFDETGTDGSYIYLVDRSRTKPGDGNNPMMMRLPVRGGSAQWSYQNPVNWIDFTVVVPSP